jgi:hypothetical protein
MQGLSKNNVLIETHGGKYEGKKKWSNQKLIEVIDKNTNVCISIPATYTYSWKGIKDFSISTNGSFSPELESLIVQGLILWYTQGHIAMNERFKDPDSFSFKIKRKKGVNFVVYNFNNEEVMNSKSSFRKNKITLKNLDGLDLGQLTRNRSFSNFKITDFTTNNELDFSRGKHPSDEFTSSNQEYYSSMRSIIYDSMDNEIFSIYGFNKDFKIYKEENHLSEVFVILISIMLILTYLIPRDTGGP